MFKPTKQQWEDAGIGALCVAVIWCFYEIMKLALGSV